VTRLIASKRDTKQKLSPYECGFEPSSDARGKQDILFYVVAILSILSDVELVFPLPRSVASGQLSAAASASVFFFIILLVLGLSYEVKHDALN